MEMLDLVNENDEVVNTLSRDEIYKKGLRYIRAVEAFIRNSKGQLWIPIRTSHKEIAPNGFDTGCGGHVEHGETYDEAFEKETREELDWDINKLSLKKIGKF